MSNVVDFTKILTEKNDEKVEQVLQDIAEEEEFIGRFAVQAAIDIVEVAFEQGFDVNDNPETIKDIMMIIESVAGLMTRIRGENCAFHDIPDGVFRYTHEETEKLFNDFLDNSGVFT